MMWASWTQLARYAITINNLIDFFCRFLSHSGNLITGPWLWWILIQIL